MKLSRREAVLCALCVVVVLVVGLPSLRQMRHPGSESESIEQLALKGTRARREVAALRREIEQVEKSVRALTWPGQPDRLPPLLMKQVQKTAAETGVALASFRPGRAVAVASGGKLPVTVQVQAPYPRAAAFLTRLQSTQSRVALERVQLAAVDAASDKVSLELRLAVYSSGAPTATPSRTGAASGRR